MIIFLWTMIVLGRFFSANPASADDKKPRSQAL
jgi:hypothetical protein